MGSEPLCAQPAGETLQLSSSAWIHEPRTVAAINDAILRHSRCAALTLLPLPPPPSLGGEDGVCRDDAGRANGDAYTHALRALTNGLPPTVLARSNGSSVITTEI
jgi:hypothetical protein